MAAVAPILSTVFKGGRRGQKAFSLVKPHLYILEEKFSQSHPQSSSEVSLSGTLAFAVCRTVATLAPQKPGKKVPDEGPRCATGSV